MRSSSLRLVVTFRPGQLPKRDSGDVDELIGHGWLVADSMQGCNPDNAFGPATSPVLERCGSRLHQRLYPGKRQWGASGNVIAWQTNDGTITGLFLPSHMPEVLITNGWERMRWKRWADDGMGVRPWTMDVIDTSDLPAEQVATEVLGWCRRVLTGQTALLSARDDQRA